MAGLTVRNAFGKLQDILFSKDLRKELFVTGQKMGSSRRALDTFSMAVYQVSTDVIEAGSTNNLVNLTAHGAKEGDFLQINTTANGINEFEVSIDEIIDANSFRLGCILSASLAAGDTVTILRPITPRMSATGATLATITPSPIIFSLDGVDTEVTEDTVDANNNKPLPVKLMGLTGPVTLNADQINVHNSHTGANPDSVQIGDGTTTLAIEAVTGKALVKDETAIAKLTDIETNQDDVTATYDSPIVTKGVQTAHKIVEYATMDGAGPAVQGVNGDAATPLVDEYGTQYVFDHTNYYELQGVRADILTLIGKFGTLGQKASAGSAPVVLSTEQEAILSSLATKLDTVIAKDFSTAAKQDSQITEATSTNTKLDTVIAKDFATQTTLALMKTALDSVLTGEGAVADAAVSNPASSGSMIALLKGILTLITSTNTKLDTLDTNSSPALDSTVTSVTTTGTLTPPASAKGMIIQNGLNSDAFIRFTGSAGTPSTTEGFFLDAGQSTSYMPAGEVKYAYGGSGTPDVSVIWFV